MPRNYGALAPGEGPSYAVPHACFGAQGTASEAIRPDTDRVSGHRTDRPMLTNGRRLIVPCRVRWPSPYAGGQTQLARRHPRAPGGLGSENVSQGLRLVRARRHADRATGLVG